MFGPDEHDQAVARTSHLPHLLAALVAGRLTDAPREHLALSGQGVRDVTRIAAGDPGLWQQIIAGNTTALSVLLRDVRDDVDTLLTALSGGDRESLAAVLGRGVEGTAVIPGKHGGTGAAATTVFVAVPDHPGELARLLSEPARSGSTSRTCASTTTRAATTASSSSASRPSPSTTCSTRSATGAGRRTGEGLDRLDHPGQLHCQVNSTSAALASAQGWSPRVIQ